MLFFFKKCTRTPKTPQDPCFKFLVIYNRGRLSADDATVLNTCCFCDVTITLSGPFEYGGDANC